MIVGAVAFIKIMYSAQKFKQKQCCPVDQADEQSKLTANERLEHKIVDYPLSIGFVLFLLPDYSESLLAEQTDKKNKKNHSPIVRNNLRQH